MSIKITQSLLVAKGPQRLAFTSRSEQTRYTTETPL